MNPLLVDRCKNSKISHVENAEEKFNEASTSIKSSIKVGDTGTISCFPDEALRKKYFLKSYEDIYREVMLDPKGVYLTSQIALEEEMFSQMLQKKLNTRKNTKYKTDALYNENLKTIVYQIVEKS